MGRIAVWLLTIILLAVGLTLSVGGAILIGNSGSPYYVITGIAVLASALALAAGRWQSVAIYGGMLVVTIVWSLFEVGLDGWALAPRLIAPAVLGLLFLARPIRRRLAMASHWWIGAPILAIAAIITVAAIIPASTPREPSAPSVVTSPATADGEWRDWGGTLAGTRYAPAAQINASNVSKLKLAWQFDPGIPPANANSFEATPLAADGRLYVCVGQDVIVALDQETGHELWRFDAHTDFKNIRGARCRGVSYFRASQPLPACQQRILFGTADARLIALDAENGNVCASFGDKGTVDLKIGMGEFPPGTVGPTSPPTIVNGIAILGQAVSDSFSIDAPSGVVRGYDAVSGELRWAWDVGHPDRTGLLPPGEVYTRDTPNAWTVMSGDEKLGLVFLPTGNSPPDQFGPHRSAESEKYASSLVAIDVATGTVRWSFQTVHHDLWDYDLPSQPVAIDLPGPQEAIPALIVPTKRGQLFMLDRRDGHSLDPIEERAVPQDAVQGDWASKTQPYTTGFPSVAGADLREADMWGLTPLDQLWCRIQFRQAHYEGQFTPPSVHPTIHYPGMGGGSNWGGVAVDTDRGLMVVNTVYMADLGRLIPRAEVAKAQAVYRRSTRSRFYLQEKTPYAYAGAPFMSPLVVPCQRPPYGRLSVFDIKSRALVWSKPFGTAAGSGPLGLSVGLPIPMGVPNMGGSVTTGGGLVFIAAAQDRKLRAYDIATGRELWHALLPAIGAAVPMTYVSKASGRQFIVIAAGGHFAIPGPSARALVAFALPRAE